MSPWRIFWSVLVFTAVALAWTFGIVALVALADEPEAPPAHECHLLNLPEPEWAVTATVLESATHGKKVFMLVRTEDGCSCLLEGGQGVTAPPKGAQVKIYGIRLGIPGFTRLQLVAMEIEIPA
jgi:hypothetical protein